jgi:ABC-2 type transport system permease protein
MKQRLGTIWVIGRRELTTRARSRAFRISSVVLLVSLILGIVVPAVFLRGTDRYTVAVVSPADGALAAAVASQADAAGLTVTTREVTDRATAVQLVEVGTVAAAVAPGEVVWKSNPDARLAPPIDAALARIAVAERARALGLTSAQVTGLFAAAAPTVTLLHATPDRGAQTVIALAGMILLFAALTFYGSFVLTGVVEEKSSRVVEVLLARVRPADLLAGKVLGIGLLGIGQFVALAAVAAVALQIVRPANLPSGVTPLIAIVVVWFVLGYSFYSVLYGALGALATRSEEAQAAAAPLTVVLVLIYFGAFSAIGTPTAWWVTVGSLFPPTAPIFMPLRVGLTDVPAWQMILAVVLMLGAIAGMIQVGGRLYQGAVLHTAGRLRIRQAWHHTTGSVSSTN